MRRGRGRSGVHRAPRARFDGTAAGPAVLFWYLTVAPVLLLIGFRADLPSGPTFNAPGEASMHLDPGTYAVYLDVTSDSGSARVDTRIRVTDPAGRPVAVDRRSRAPDLSLDSERISTLRDHARFVVPAAGQYRVRVDTAQPRTVLVNPPWSRWRIWWPALLVTGAMVGPLAAWAAVSQREERRRGSPTTVRAENLS